MIRTPEPARPRPAPPVTQPLMPHQIAARLDELDAAIARATAEADRCDTEATDAEVAYLQSFAVAFVEAAGTDKVRTQAATLATINAKADLEGKKLALRTARRALDKFREQRALVQSQGALVRAELSTSQWGRP